MLIIPLEKSIDWRKPPVVTILLILINTLILFITNGQEEKAFHNATDYYLSSQLPAIELPRYIETQSEAIIDDVSNPELSTHIKKNDADGRIIINVLMTMENDQDFMKKLHKDEIINLQDKNYSEWKSARTQFEKTLNNTISDRYKFVPSEHKPITFITHQYLHGGYDHLIGNMLFLFLIGFALETALGSLLYFVCYCVAGLGAVILFWQIYPTSDVGLVGASGAISGLMGMYAGVFGLRKIRFFYSLLFYFDYIKAPALIMLPLWVLNEMYQLHSNTGSHVAYVAHIGGLLTGGLISFAIKQYFTEQIDTHYLDVDVKNDEKMLHYEQGIKLLSELKISQSQQVFSKLYAEYPEDKEILLQYYKTLKYTPDLPEHHRIVTKIFEAADMSDVKQISQIFNDYSKRFSMAKLSEKLLVKLAILFSKGNCCLEAELIIKTLLQQAKEVEGLDQAIFVLATAWKRMDNFDKYIKYLKFLAQNYPARAIGINASKLLKESKS